ncbi:MAG: cupin domain-containing protein [Ruminococcus sp.]|nr:cupin domain-containing protein [Ruminococcus sp.]
MENKLFTPPDHINFAARKLYGEGDISDVSIAFIDENGGGPSSNHTHKHNHLFIVTEGEAKIILDGEEIILKKNESFLVKGEIPHSVWNNQTAETTMIGINIMP